jgi:hypothetical protein
MQEIEMAAALISRVKTIRIRDKVVDVVRIKFPYNDQHRVAFRQEFGRARWNPSNTVLEIPNRAYDRVAELFSDLWYVVLDGIKVVADAWR